MLSLEDIGGRVRNVCSQGEVSRKKNKYWNFPKANPFKAGDIGAEFNFFSQNPGLNATKKVTVYYSLTDSYGKSSSRISMNPQRFKIGPSQINLRVFGNQEIRKWWNTNFVKGESVSFNWLGEKKLIPVSKSVRRWWIGGRAWSKHLTQSTESGEYQILLVIIEKIAPAQSIYDPSWLRRITRLFTISNPQ